MPGEEEPKARPFRPLAIPLLIAFIVWFILLLLYAFPKLVPPSNLSFELWQNLGNLVLAVMIFWAALSRFTFAPVEGPEGVGAAAKGKEDETPIEAEVVPEPAGGGGAEAKRPKPRAAQSAATEKVLAVAERAKGVTVATAEGAEAAPGLEVAMPEEGVRIVEWPPKKPGGVYSDTLIQVDYDLVLNMRTRLGRVCGNCEGLPECKKRVGGRLPDDVFDWNFECKEGLKRELARIRRAKQGEAAAKPSPVPPEAAPAPGAGPVEAKGAAEAAPSPQAVAGTPIVSPAAQPQPKAAEAKAEARHPETTAPPPAKAVEAAPEPSGPTGEPKEKPAADATPIAPQAPVPSPAAQGAPADEELEIEPEPSPVETEQPAPQAVAPEGRTKLRKKLLKRKD